MAADPTSGKAWARKGAALHGMALWGEAIVAYEEASPHEYPYTSWMATQSNLIATRTTSLLTAVA